MKSRLRTAIEKSEPFVAMWRNAREVKKDDNDRCLMSRTLDSKWSIDRNHYISQRELFYSLLVGKIFFNATAITCTFDNN